MQLGPEAIALVPVVTPDETGWRVGAVRRYANRPQSAQTVLQSVIESRSNWEWNGWREMLRQAVAERFVLHREYANTRIREWKDYDPGLSGGF